MRYTVKLSYDGASFCGWQVQSGEASVQECLEDALSKLLRTKTGVTGAGRTDSKVNAIGYVAHFDIEDVGAPDPAELAYKLNAILPPSVVVHSVTPAAPDFHARFDACQRKYTYFLHRMKDPFVEKYSLRRDWDLDFEAMNRAAALLVGRHDFACFEKTGTDVKTTVCTVREAYWAPYVPSHVALMGFEPAAAPKGLGPECQSPSGSGDLSLRGMLPERDWHPGPDNRWRYVYFRISADRFLRNMVRAIVGTLLEVGRGKRSVEDLAALILDAPGPADDAAKGAFPERGQSGSLSGATPVPAEGRSGSLRSLAGDSVPGHALFFSGAEYPED